MKIEQLVPNLKKSIDGAGFFIGSGASAYAGYPLVTGLTKIVIDSLEESEVNLLNNILKSEGLTYDSSSGQPNIEDISDIVNAFAIKGECGESIKLSKKIETLVRKVLFKVKPKHPTLHIQFLEQLKCRANDNAAKVHIFTTNYDLLFEIAAAYTGINLVNGFTGSILRFFSDQEFGSVTGTLRNKKFSEVSRLTIYLYKLHGSLSWYKIDNEVFEMDPRGVGKRDECCMILPRRKKILDSDEFPYSQIFSISRNVLESGLRDMISVGFSFSDQHINEFLILPMVRKKNINLFNFCDITPPKLGSISGSTNVFHSSEEKSGQDLADLCNRWKFDEFVNLF